MQTLTSYVPYSRDQFPYWVSAAELSLLLDIETTGFSARNSSIYMIGCGTFQSDQIMIEQYFAESPEAEAEILQTLSEKLAPLKTLYTFNGSGFDLPFLKERMKKYRISSNLDALQNCDIFKEVSTLKNLIHLENYKQKTVERFLDVSREDVYDGGQLIGVYQDYLREPNSEALNLLFLHNQDDVRGMGSLLALYRYHRFLKGDLTLENSRIHSYHNLEGEEAFELLLTLSGTVSVPVGCSAGKDNFFLTLSGSRLQLRAPVRSGELRYFYPDYRNYYYLAVEDRAIHKSIASYVDPDYREKCRASNCYTRKSGLFLPQEEPLIAPAFQVSFKSHPTYFELTPEFFSEPENLLVYGKKIIEWVLS